MPIQKVSPVDLLGPLNDVERKNAPSVLFVSGDIELCRSLPKVSVIGTRAVTPDGVKRTQNLVRMLVARDVVIVSGLARGVDTCAHESAIEAGGKTIAVLGTPLDRVYPPENAALQKKISLEHLAISQFPSGHTLQKKDFPIRNRTMALISHATVIVEAGEGSGTLHQGWEALRLGRPLFIMESLTQNQELKWPGEMMEYGAQVLSRETMGALFDSLPQGSPFAELAEIPF